MARNKFENLPTRSGRISRRKVGLPHQIGRKHVVLSQNKFDSLRDVSENEEHEQMDFAHQ